MEFDINEVLDVLKRISEPDFIKNLNDYEQIIFLNVVNDFIKKCKPIIFVSSLRKNNKEN